MSQKMDLRRAMKEIKPTDPLDFLDPVLVVPTDRVDRVVQTDRRKTTLRTMTHFPRRLQGFSENPQMVAGEVAPEEVGAGIIEETMGSLRDLAGLHLVDRKNSLEALGGLTASFEVEEVVGEVEEGLEDKILTKGLATSVAEVQDLVEDLVVAVEILVVVGALEDVEDKMVHLEDEAVVVLEDQECGWTKEVQADRLVAQWTEGLEDHLEDPGVRWMDRWTVLSVAITIILTTVDVAEGVEEAVLGKKEAGVAEEEASLVQTVQWKVHLMDLMVQD